MTTHQSVVNATIERLASDCEIRLASSLHYAMPKLQAAWQHQLLAKGKRLRLRLSLRTALTLGITEEQCQHLACACELVHQASLIHDDLMDKDRYRNNVSTIWYEFNSETAICLGDTLLVEAFFLINTIPHIDAGSMRALATIFRDSVHAAAEGQVRDCDTNAVDNYTYIDYVDAVQRKSGALLGLPVVSAMVLQGSNKDNIVTVTEAFAELGVVYQLLDDIEDRNIDENHRLNGYWILARNAPKQDIYQLATINIEEHLKVAERLLATQEESIQNCFGYIKTLIFQKHSKLAVAS